MRKEIKQLVDYIDSIIKEPDKAKIDTSNFDSEYTYLAASIERLGDWSLQARQFVREVTREVEESRIKSSPENSGKDKDLDCNELIFELKKRTSALESERSLFVKFTESANERIVVLDEKTGDMVYANKIAREYFESTKEYIDSAEDINYISGCNMDKTYSKWIHRVYHPDNGKAEYYQVHSIYIIWEGRSAIAHMFSDVTESVEASKRASKDMLTGAYTRTFGMDYLEEIYLENRNFVLAFVDVDYLKYCNDTFGHDAGDSYLKEIVNVLFEIDEKIIVCRTGGDEFLVIGENLSEDELKRRIEEKRQKIHKEYFMGGKIRKNFSYGIALKTRDTEISLKELIGLADEHMYENKLENKKNNHMRFKDSRL